MVFIFAGQCFYLAPPPSRSGIRPTCRFKDRIVPIPFASIFVNFIYFKSNAPFRVFAGFLERPGIIPKTINRFPIGSKHEPATSSWQALRNGKKKRKKKARGRES